MTRFHRGNLFETITEHAADLIFITAAARLFSNIMELICMLRLFALTNHSVLVQYTLAVLISGALTVLVSVIVPNAGAKYAGETFIALCAPLLLALRIALWPATKIMHRVDDVIRRAAGATDTPHADQIEEEILSAVDEGTSQGIVDEGERMMIESVINFRNTTAGQIMTARTDVVAIELPATLEDVKRVIDESAHSRIPVFASSLDHIVGVLYARDLLQYVGLPPETFDIRRSLRPAFYVPETKPLRNLLSDFRLQKVHIAIVLDEYGGTAGLVTIEDVIEELVGDIVDEHETSEPALLRRISDTSWDADARVPMTDLNRTIGLDLPEDAGYETLGGFVSTALGSIPAAGTVFEHASATFRILDAEPQRVNRVRIDLPATHALAPAPTAAPAPPVDSVQTPALSGR